MTLKSAVANGVSNVVYKVLGNRNLINHVAIHNLKKTKPKNLGLFDFELFTYHNKGSKEADLYEACLDQTKLHHEDNLSKRLRHYTLFQLLDRVLASGIEGNVVESGCFQGQSAYGMASILQEYNFKSKMMIFDSFQGLSELSPQDKNEIRELTKEEEQFQKESFSASLEKVQENLKDFNFIEYYKGWIPERYLEVENETFSFVHIDVDLYQPIKDSLEFFYPRLAKGGIIALDDYGLSQFPGAKTATDEFLSKENPEFFMWYPFGGAFILK